MVSKKIRASIFDFSRLYTLFFFSPPNPNRQLKVSCISYCYQSEVENSPAITSRLSARGRRSKEGARRSSNRNHTLGVRL